MSELRFLLTVSRPRFWLYIFGPFIVGLAAGSSQFSDFHRLEAIIFGLYFLFPANLLIYGVNDIFDYETDRRNAKKNEYEILVKPEVHGKLWMWIALTNIPFLIAAYFIAFFAIGPLIGFLFFSIFYSAKPIRAKARPILDSAFNILYIFPGAFSYQLLTGAFPPITLFAAGGLWAMAMHAYSAIPDIEADREANVATVATFLNKGGTLVFCLAMYLGSAILAYPYLGILAVIIGCVYAGLIVLSFASRTTAGIFGIYRQFPFVNAAIGFFLFWFAAWPKLL